jgi:hypothetical protein
MQLPRGTFREIRKNVAIESLLHELNGEKFSGVASISSQSRTGTLVFKEGKCILVKIQNSRGDEGWDEIQKAGDVEVDAALSVLGDAQIDLALEFNKPCRILKTGTFAPAQASSRPVPAATNEHPRAAMGQKAAVPVAPLKSPLKPAPTHHHVPAPPSVAPPSQAHTPPPHSSLFSKAAAPAPPSSPVPTPVHTDSRKHETDEPPESDQETSTFENDLDTFDTMDFENVTDKIRTDCKTMIKQLHLDHLMER